LAGNFSQFLCSSGGIVPGPMYPNKHEGNYYTEKRCRLHMMFLPEAYNYYHSIPLRFIQNFGTFQLFHQLEQMLQLLQYIKLDYNEKKLSNLMNLTTSVHLTWEYGHLVFSDDEIGIGYVLLSEMIELMIKIGLTLMQEQS
jgi:hypothetical protein